MNISYTQKLHDYLKRRGYAVVEISMAEPGTDTSGFAEVTAIPLTAKVAEKVRDQALRVIPIEGDGEVFIMSRGIEYDDEIVLDLKSFLGIKHIDVQGMRAFSLR